MKIFSCVLEALLLCPSHYIYNPPFAPSYMHIPVWPSTLPYCIASLVTFIDTGLFGIHFVTLVCLFLC